MRQPNPVQPIAQHIQRFGQQPISLGPPPAGAEQAIQQQMHELAMEIYTRLAADHISDDHYTRPLSVELLRQLAGHSQVAARAYFEQMGVQFSDHQA